MSATDLPVEAVRARGNPPKLLRVLRVGSGVDGWRHQMYRIDWLNVRNNEAMHTACRGRRGGEAVQQSLEQCAQHFQYSCKTRQVLRSTRL